MPLLRALQTRRVVALLVAALALLTACEPAPPRAHTASARDSHELVNLERTGRGYGALVGASDLQQKAQAHADKMAAEQRLSHTHLPSGVQGGYKYLSENVGVGSSVQTVHDSFMASSGHRRNVLDGRASWIGVGVAKSADGRVWVAQVFKG